MKPYSLYFLRALSIYVVGVTRPTLTCVLVLALWLIAVGAAHGNTYNVTSCADAGTGSLREAVESANANPGDDVVTFGPLSCSTITLASTISIRDSVAIMGPIGTLLTITSPNERALMLEPAIAAPGTQAVSISRLRFADSFATASEAGGAISSIRTHLTVSSSVFEGNDSPQGGGAIYFQSFGAEPQRLSISFTSFLNNTARAGSTSLRGGGAILQDGSGLTSIRRSLFRQNGTTATDGAGGAIRSNDAKELTIAESGFYENTTGTSGGAISVYGEGETRISSSSFVGNVAQGRFETDFGGGAIENSTSALIVQNSTFAANAIEGSETLGSAIASRGSVVTLLNTTVAQNEVRSFPATNAAIVVFSAPGTENRVATLTLNNTVVTTNFASDGSRRNDVWVDGRGGAVNFSSATSLVSLLRNGNALIEAPGDARLDSATNNGGVAIGEQTSATGVLQTMVAGIGSALINAGSNAAAANLETDQRGVGFSRIVGGTVDIGAIERAEEVIASSVATMPLGMMVLYIVLCVLAVFTLSRTSTSFKHPT
jgi:fibronectin-binding autotransporter adhesin